jgi:multiple sugar transport system ATP-binding protein
MIYVTHDQVEAMTMADRIVVLRGGVIEQVGAPLELYNRPLNRFVAGFIGSPRMNFLEGRVGRVGVTEFEFECAGLGATNLPHHGRALTAGQAVAFGERPEDLEMTSEGRNAWTVRVELSEQHGSNTYLHCATPGNGELLLHLPGQSVQARGDMLHVRPAAGRWHLFGPDDRRIEPELIEPLALVKEMRS